MESSKERLIHQFESQKEDIKTWKKKYDEKRCDIEKATKDFKTSKLQWFLDKYIQGKEAEVNRSKKSSQVIHMKRINKLFNTEIGNFTKSQNLSLEMLQTNYYILLADGALDSEIVNKYTKLDQLINGTGTVKFDQSVDDTTDENASPDMSSYDIMVDESSSVMAINSNGKRIYQNSSSGASSDSDISIDGAKFKKPRIVIQPPKPVQNLNETISFADAHNSTFEVAKAKMDNQEIIKGILSDHSNNTQNREKISKGKFVYSLKKLLFKSVSGDDLTNTIGMFSLMILLSPSAITKFISNSILKFLVMRVGQVNNLGRIM